MNQSSNKVKSNRSISHNKSVSIGDLNFPSVLAACRYFHISETKVYSRLRSNWTLEEAFELVPRPKYAIRDAALKATIVSAEGVDYPSARDACLHYNVNLFTYYNRIKRGWSVEEALGIVPPSASYKVHNCIPIEVNGVRYESVSAACRAHNISFACFQNRLKLGWSVEKALTTPLRHRTSPIKSRETVTVEKTVYPSISAACRAYNLRPSLVRSRIARGWTIEEAFEVTQRISPSKGHIQPITVNDVPYPSIAAACRALNLPVNQTYGRIKRGWTIEEAFNIQSPTSPKKSITVNKKTYPSVSSAARALGLDRRSVWYRIKKGMTIEEAFAQSPISRHASTAYKFVDPISVENKNYATLSEAANAYGLKPAVVHARLNTGWTIEEAFELVEHIRPTNRVQTGTKIKVLDVTYPSISAACHALNVPVSQAYSRIKIGWTIEEAFGIVPRNKVRRNSVPLTVNNVFYPSIAAACKHFGVSVHTYFYRKKKGLSVEEALGATLQQECR